MPFVKNPPGRLHEATFCDKSVDRMPNLDAQMELDGSNACKQVPKRNLINCWRAFNGYNKGSEFGALSRNIY